MQNTSDFRNKTYKKPGRRVQNLRNAAPERRPYVNYMPHKNSSVPMEAKVATNATNISNQNTEDNKEKPAEVLQNGELGSDGEFQTVAPKSVRRKERLKELREQIESSHHRHRDKHRIHSRRVESNERSHKDRDHHFNPKESSKDKDKEKEKEKEKDKDSETGSEENGQPIKYVEAPLPTINPWNKGKTNRVVQTPAPVAPAPAATPAPPTAPVVAAPKPVVAKPLPVVVPEKPIEKEKKVLPVQQPKPKIGEF